jgi:ComF family protein
MNAHPRLPQLQPWLDLGRQAIQGIIHLIYPPTCHLCGQALAPDGSRFCTRCAHLLPEDFQAACPRCAVSIGAYSQTADGCPRCRAERFWFDQAVRLGLYKDSLREAILRMKQATGEDLAEALGHLWAEHAAARLRALAVDVVVPVPLHWIRRWQRGYNQAETLARALAAKLGVPCRTRWLWRARYTAHQTGQGRTARKANLRGAFRAAARPELRGKKVLLVDDVLTTGTTCSEAARVLKRAGAARVAVAVLARSDDA